ncbi:MULTISPECIES: MFS transporter [unclassified Crossiella]|uniref:MFS transporter n=1 Tax=unclassified Crossiella TaxID=2620835 RepID=UPI001FFE749D|nr:MULTISPECIES: MFS transporter [unclassified Crossiella]MCK2236245.1 MFS transporter [Crossiella sp. S99.2]MCK2249912.1 MFS transporter [Crossiella sp. S99.1]
MQTAEDSVAGGGQTPHKARAGLRHLLTNPGFFRLLGVKITAQWGDGVFQAGLGSAVLFNPERAADPLAAAAGFAVIFLPYSVVGPFAGALLDRWDRRQVLLLSNVIRGVLVLVTAVAVLSGLTGPALYVAALLTLGVSRFMLAGLSASLPHLVPKEDLVEANAVAATLGAGMAVVGAGSAIGLRALLGAGDAGSGTVTAIAVLGSIGAALIMLGFRRGQLGPDEVNEPSRALVAIAHGLIDGARAAARTTSVAAGFVALVAHRLAYGALVLLGVLLLRNSFHDVGWLPSGMGGVGVIALAGGASILAAAFVTPPLVAKVGRRATITGSLVLAALTQLVLTLTLSLPALLLSSFLIIGAGQVVKLCVDAAAQRDIGDETRGRVFALYDTLFNVSMVVSAGTVALLVPADGHSTGVMLGVVVVYLIGTVCYLLVERRGQAQASRTGATGRESG